LLGHSAGAHLILMALLEKIFQSGTRTLYTLNPPKKTTWKCHHFKKVVLLAGVYDIRKHYDFEAARAVEDISTMKPAMRDYLFFPQYSPITVLKHFTKFGLKGVKASTEDFSELSPKKENEERHETKIREEFRKFPNLELLHSRVDKTVPFSSTEKLFKNLKKLNVPNVEYQLLEELEHTDWVLGMMGARGVHVMFPLVEKYFQGLLEEEQPYQE